MINIDNEKCFVIAVRKIAEAFERWVELQHQIKEDEDADYVKMQEKIEAKKRGFSD